VKHVAHGQSFCNCVAKVVIISVVANTAPVISDAVIRLGEV